MTDFKVGDRVRVVNYNDSLNGSIGRIRSLAFDAHYPFTLDLGVAFKGDFLVTESEIEKVGDETRPSVFIRESIVVSFGPGDEHELTAEQANALIRELEMVV